MEGKGRELDEGVKGVHPGRLKSTEPIDEAIFHSLAICVTGRTRFDGSDL
jgi:hypothetical protein